MIGPDFSGRKKGTGPPIGKRDRAASSIFRGFVEIANAAETLHDMRIYVRRFPFGGTSISRSKYLRFIIESYLHESYILTQRLLAYPEKIRRVLARDDASGRYREIVKTLQTFVKGAMANL